MSDNFKIDYNNLTDEDRVAMAEAYRTFEILDEIDQSKIPEDFVETLLKFGDINSVKPFESIDDFDKYQFSQKGKYLLMYMCTFE